VQEAYETFEFHLVYHELVQYCAADLSAVYFDILKDRLYCDATDGPRRRSAQTVLYRLVRDLPRLFAPVLPMTADEVWRWVPKQRESSVHLALFPEKEIGDKDVIDRWQRGLFPMRDAVLKVLEEARAAKRITASLEAEVHIEAPSSVLAPLQAYEEQSRFFPGNLANLFIVSGVYLRPGAGSAEGAKIEVRPAAGKKCERCWTYSTKVGERPVHPGVCPRCADVLEAKGVHA
jgi:isoleucyl-tRNA synthetase